MQRASYLKVVMGLLAVLAGCTGQRGGQDRVIVDTQGVDLHAYDHDVEECEAYADQVRVGHRAAGGVLAGAVIGGAVGAIAGDHHTAERAAGVGGVVGGARGVGSGVRERDSVIKNCLRGRGYRVLN